jgi:hypothetical protein
MTSGAITSGETTHGCLDASVSIPNLYIGLHIRSFTKYNIRLQELFCLRDELPSSSEVVPSYLSFHLIN